MRRIGLAVLLVAAVSAPAGAAAGLARDTPSACPPPPRPLGVQQVPSGTRVGGDAFGGISGLDYDAARRRWWLLSDDRAPARFFKADLRIGRRGFTDLHLLGSRRLAGLDGAPDGATRAAAQAGAAPAAAAGRRDLFDGEALRLDPRRGDLLLATEGDSALGIVHGVRRYRIDGSPAGELALPPGLRLSLPAAAAAASGPRANRSIEGLALAPDGRHLWIALESPLQQDGPEADAGSGADLRLTRLALPRVREGSSLRAGLRQFVYRTDAALAHDPGESSDNGISEILQLDAQVLLVLERSGRQMRDGSFRFRTRLYCAEVAGATDVAALEGLRDAPWQPVRKRLLLEFADLPDGAGNYEAMAWGPSLGRGRRTLVVASDDNFFAGVPTVFLAFEVRRAAR